MNVFHWHPHLVSASRYGRFTIWRRGVRRGALLAAWEFALDPARADEAIRRRRAFAGDRGVARYRDLVCQGCSSLPCIC